MTLFELLFALSSVILGLALANLASSLQRLALKGREVRWAPEPLLQAALITLIIIQVWLDQWFSKDMKQLVYAAATLTILRLMTLFFAAASCLPDSDLLGDGAFDLKAYYYRARKLSYGAMIIGLWLFALTGILNGYSDWQSNLVGFVVGPGLYGLLIWSDRRWLHILVLLFVLGAWGVPTMMLDIKT
ncbi:hypothetical protein GCM10022280_20480 [Sphingomonas swuensis]|uniref:Uncharacterized protein n=1 Tax=Sphingomonas swuensis TaxID=977800 RepID=A0ABP7T2I3_9SPHN